MNTQVLENEKCEQKNTLHNRNAWTRLAYMVLFAVLLQVAGMVMWMVCTLQFLFVLGTGADNSQLRVLGGGLAEYIKQALEFVSYNTDTKPFPFQRWPEATIEKTEVEVEVKDAENTQSEDDKS